ncbi:hybrid sensor histidine kinase/response regulator [Salipiger mucosus]|nr:PAS domain-containing hybrid sensor histidine kinase/response regulator [Salipiger mucosus]
MPQIEGADRPSLAEFEARVSPAGRLERYARGRVRHFLSRQVATLAGSLALGLLVSPMLGLFTAALALLGEAVDCGVLRRVPAALAAGRSVRGLRRLTTFTAGIQALTISGCVLAAQATAMGGEASLFSFAFLAAAVLNAGVVLTYHPGAARARIAIYAAVAVVGFLAQIVTGETGRGLVYDAVGLAMLGFIAAVFLRFVEGAERRRTEDSRRLLEGQQALARANAELRDKQAEARRLALVARHASDSIMLCDPRGRIQWVNEGFTRLRGHSVAEAVGRHPVDLAGLPDGDPSRLRRIARAMLSGESWRGEMRGVTRDGREIWVDTVVVPIAAEAGGIERIIVTERDVTEARHHAEDLAEAKARAEEAARAKAAFLATMSHEIRTPMNGIIGMVDLLTETALTRDQGLYADTIRTSAEALLKIINDILDYSRLEADKMPIVSEPFSPAACIRDAIDLLRPQAREKGLFLDLCHEAALPEAVRGDSGRLRQVLINLLGNAVKFTEAGGVTLGTGIASDEDGHLLTLRVSDTGPGIAPARAERIFDQFEQADNGNTRPLGGTGLGLAISRQLARRMGGDLTLIDNEAPGACFELTVRLGRAPPGAVRDHLDRLGVAGGRVPPMRLLLAEDNATNRLLVRRFLRDQPVTIAEAADGRAATDAVQAAPPDVVLMDMAMPELDGLAATRLIREMAIPQPRIIALTANAFASDRAACLEAGMDDFLAKPLRKAALLEALARAGAADGRGRAGPEKQVGPSPPDAVSPDRPEAHEAPIWTSRQESGTTSGRSTRSSAR